MKIKNNINNAINYFIGYITPVPIQIVVPCPMLFLSYLQTGLLDVSVKILSLCPHIKIYFNCAFFSFSY